MAERMRKTPEFYVYRFDDDDGCVYIGKGCRTRFKAQERRFRMLAPIARGQIFDWFLTEAAALEAEKQYIAKYAPRLNLTAGGNGGRVKRRRPPRMQQWERCVYKFGSRKYAARLLVECERAKPGVVDPSKLERIRQVAYGPRA